jgi:SPP1 gp7 family putative phage head morphogenesis protein
MNASTLATYKDRGVKKKKWLDAGDSKVRPEHKNNTGQGAIPVEEAFSSGELYPNAVNCRCCIAPAIEV